MKCYIAGPMRGLPEYNYPAFMDADDQLTAAGWETYNPAKMDIENDVEDHAAQSVDEHKIHDTARNARRFAHRDVKVLIDILRAENGDAVIVLPGWKGSIGALAEVAVAKWVMLPILTLEAALEAPPQ